MNYQMNVSETNLPPSHRAVTKHFIAACQADARVLAAFLGGSYASGAADAYSDLDLYLITTDEGYEDFLVGKEAFIRQLGEPLFLEDWGTAHYCFFILADGVEGELGIGHASRFKHIHGGAYAVLVDKQNILSGVDFPMHTADPAEQIDTLRRLIMTFWHEVAHFNKALAREQTWFAYGSLEVMRNICINLARLHYNFADAGVDEEPYFKIEHAMPVEQLAPLLVTFCPLEKEAIQQAGLVILQFYRALAMDLAVVHGIAYPVVLERLTVAQSTKLG
jgi:hypothetical protein